MASLQIGKEQSDAIEDAIIKRLGIPADSPALRGGISFNSDGRVKVEFYIPRAELEAIINEAGCDSEVA